MERKWKKTRIVSDAHERQVLTGAFYTPLMWTKMAIKYITDALGADWQEHYYIWDCAAGQGNLLQCGLKYPERIFATTLEPQDVDIMQRQAMQGLLPLVPQNIAQFDFLNDDFCMLPDRLQYIIKYENKKLLMLINPPYGGGKLCMNSKCYYLYRDDIGKAAAEMQILFWHHIRYAVVPAYIASFGKVVFTMQTYIYWWLEYMWGEVKRMFLVPSWTFGGVKGKFGIAFTLQKVEWFSNQESILCDIYDENSNALGHKKYYFLPYHLG
jgi:hypothetical protein